MSNEQNKSTARRWFTDIIAQGQLGVADEIGEDNFFRLGDDVFGILVGRLNAEVCRNCTARIFHPCRQRPASDATLAA